MISLLTSALFAAACALALGAIAGSWRRYGAAALALRGELDACSDLRELRFTVTGFDASRPSATILRPSFRPARMAPEFEPEWQAAA
ncbi:MAG: hypothetical protein AB7F98_11150 [Novosphingobium sp.]